MSFVIPDQPSLDRIVSGYFQLSRLDQYSVLRRLLPNLTSTPSMQIIQTLEANDLCWPVPELTFYQAKRLQSLAREAGFEFVLEGEEGGGA